MSTDLGIRNKAENKMKSFDSCGTYVLVVDTNVKQVLFSGNGKCFEKKRVQEGGIV